MLFLAAIDNQNRSETLKLMQKADLSHSPQTTPGKLINANTNDKEIIGKTKVFDFTEMQIEISGKTITICFPDEEKQLS